MDEQPLTITTTDEPRPRLRHRGTPAPGNRVTLQHIAEEAGVTISTVSRILGNHGQYAADTRKKIFAIADRLKYRPNALIRGMQTGKTRTAGVMLPVDQSYYNQVLGGIHEALLENDTIALLSWNPHTHQRAGVDTERAIIHRMIDRCVDGILLCPSSERFLQSYFDEILDRHIPLVVIDRELEELSSDFVGTDDVHGGQTAAEYLLSLGHRRFLFVGDSDRLVTSRRRESGFRQALRETADTACESVDVSATGLREQLTGPLRRAEAPTAIFCNNDATATQVAAALREDGIRVPADVSLVGFGNTPGLDPVVPLTTFHQHPREVGATAARLYLDRVNGGSNGNGSHFCRKLIPADLVVRASTRAIS